MLGQHYKKGILLYVDIYILWPSSPDQAKQVALVYQVTELVNPLNFLPIAIDIENKLS